MSKNIEIEIRGPLSKKEFNDLVKLFDSKGEKTGEKDRVLIDYSTFLDDEIENRNKDIRLRVTNGIPEIIIKIGAWGESEHRKELSVFANKGDFDTLVEIYAALGYKKGMLCVRKSKVYQYKGIEFALVEVPGHSYYYEAEKMANAEDDPNIIVTEIKKTCKNLGLKIFNKEQFFKYIKQLNSESNEIFEHNYKKHSSNYFKKRFNL